jgi:hypothetical protein
MSKNILDNVLKELYKSHLDYCLKIKEISDKNKIKLRMPNFPEYLSENIIKFIIKNKLKLECENSLSGDLKINNLKIECKTFTSTGPISFGPNEKWDEIYFLDGTNWLKNNFILYQVKLKSNDKEWNKIKMKLLKNNVNKKEDLE